MSLPDCISDTLFSEQMVQFNRWPDPYDKPSKDTNLCLIFVQGSALRSVKILTPSSQPSVSLLKTQSQRDNPRAHSKQVYVSSHISSNVFCSLSPWREKDTKHGFNPIHSGGVRNSIHFSLKDLEFCCISNACTPYPFMGSGGKKR